MGLNNNTNASNALYILQGKIVKVATQKDSNLERNGKFYQAFDSLSGYLVGFAVVDGYKKGDKDVVLKVKDTLDETGYVLKFGLNSGNFTSFSRSIQNVDLLKEIELVPTYKEEDGKKQSSLLIKQEGEWIKRKYTNESMGKLPTAKSVVVNDKTVYDYSEQNKFLIEEITAKFEAAKLPF